MDFERLSDAEFARIRDLVQHTFGINLTDGKRSLVVSRLRRRLQEKGGITFGEYYQQVVADQSGQELSELINRISTNHTFFNREKKHFEFFVERVLPEARQRAQRDGTRDVRVWCAASSTGEEPYMLAMLMRQFFGAEFSRWKLGVLATDISEKALTKARAGVYPAERVADVPPELMRRYFVPRSDGQFDVLPEVKADVTYRRLNLINTSYPFRVPFDVVFCRNVMIYFDDPTRDAVVSNISRCLRPGGYLFIGHAETLGRRFGDLQSMGQAVYRKD